MVNKVVKVEAQKYQRVLKNEWYLLLVWDIINDGLQLAWATKLPGQDRRVFQDNVACKRADQVEYELVECGAGTENSILE